MRGDNRGLVLRLRQVPAHAPHRSPPPAGRRAGRAPTAGPTDRGNRSFLRPFGVHDDRTCLGLPRRQRRAHRARPARTGHARGRCGRRASTTGPWRCGDGPGRPPGGPAARAAPCRRDRRPAAVPRRAGAGWAAAAAEDGRRKSCGATASGRPNAACWPAVATEPSPAGARAGRARRRTVRSGPSASCRTASPGSRHGPLHAGVAGEGPRRDRLRGARRRAHGAASARARNRLAGPVPVPRGADAVVRDRPGREALPLLRLRGGRRRLLVRDGDGGAGFRRRAGVAGRAGGGGARARERGPARRRASACGASGCCALLERTAALLRARAVGEAARPPGRASTCSRAGSTRRRCASSGSATRRRAGTGC